MSGFTLSAILVVVSALFILAVGALLIVGIEQNTSRAFSDRERAHLATRAGLEDVKGILAQEAANDDFLILQSSETQTSGAVNDPPPYLYLARGSGGGDRLNYRYLPLFSVAKSPSTPEAGKPLKAPEAHKLLGQITKEMTTLPWHAPAKVAWIEIADENDKVVSRYAYWVEDLQSRVDASTAGNIADAGNHQRYGWKADDPSEFATFPAPGLNAEPSNPGPDGRDTAPPLNQIALYVLDPDAGAQDHSTLDKAIIQGRKALISPDSVLAIAGITPPLTRGEDGRLTDMKARSLEENLTAFVRPYDEQPLVPFAHGIAPAVTGDPKLNLNALLAKNPTTAVNELAAFINQGLPTFEERKGGFPEDYLKTIAASAIGYASDDNQPVVQMGNYRGLGASPMISEILLDINYLGNITRKSGERSMLFEFILFAELLNHTNLPIAGNAALSFELALELPQVSSSPTGIRFDALLGDPSQCIASPPMVQANGRYWSEAKGIILNPGEYKFYKFVTVNYAIDIGFSKFSEKITLNQKLGASGLSMQWNGEEVERIPSISRDAYGLTFEPGLKRYTGKAAIPGHSYATYPEYVSNMGDPRIAHFIRFAGGSVGSSNGVPLSENGFPHNISPNRRNIRYGSIYSNSSDPLKLKVYGRVIPSEWPDGGHDAQVTSWSHGWSSTREGDGDSHGTGPAFDPTTIGGEITPQPGEALTYLSNRGRYYSATELGRIYDPIMWLPTFDPASGLDSALLRADGEPNRGAGIMPTAGISWPSVQVGNISHKCFGGGNTLRIGRPEHPKFNQPAHQAPATMPGTHAARLLDLFHVGKSRSNDRSDREGLLVRIEGHVNINTATRDSLRAMAAGYLTMDPIVSKRTSNIFGAKMAPPVEPLTSLSAPTSNKEADTIADAIILGRPYTSPSELACVADTSGRQIFGNRDFYPDKNQIQWSDSAAEEVFGRVYEASTVRSRNFRVWVIGQALAPTSGNPTAPVVLAETRRTFTIFADPGERRTDGGIDSFKSRIIILHENDF